MSPTAEMTEVVCPRCGEQYAQWYRPATENGAISSCPFCGHDPATDRLVHEDGIWTLTAGEDEAAER